jgi:hypothetical protein
MSKFSDRIGVTSPPTSIQIKGISGELRNSLWNLIYKLYTRKSDIMRYWSQVAEYIALHFRKIPVDEVPYGDIECCIWIKSYFYGLDWYKVYNLIEFIVENHVEMTRKEHSYDYGYTNHPIKRDQFERSVNLILQNELSGYRFIAGVLSPITEEVEIKEIEEAVEQSSQVGFEGAHEHIRTSLDFLGKKPEPDHRNAIKEAISAVESVVTQLSGIKDFGAALDKLSNQINLHGALKSGFKKLYGYTSDKDGIRHAILEQPDVGFNEAKYMIVACSAFVNFLISKANETGLLKGN